MDQIELIPEIKRLCRAREYDRAIELTNEIENEEIAVRAHVLCIQHERSYMSGLGGTDKK